MKIISGNESAYPSGLWGQQTESGITIRAEFAARFLEGMLAGKGSSSSVNRAYVETAVLYADELIEELNKFGKDEN